MAIEEVFYGKNVKSALLLGHARGASMICASKYNIPVFEYSARKVKQSVTGNGNAHKSQIQFMIQKELKITNFDAPADAADALVADVTARRRKAFLSCDESIACLQCRI